MTTVALKLKIDLVPETGWYKGLREQMKRAEWDKLRRRVYAEQHDRCAICGTPGRLNCHEIWGYDDARYVQTLLGFQAVCVLCHHVTHFGKAQLLAGQGRIDLNAVIRYFLAVNQVAREVFESHKNAAFGVWRERSRHAWEIDLGEWSTLVAKKTV